MELPDLIEGLVPPELIARMRALDEQIVPPTEEDVAAVVWAVDVQIADDRMIPATYELMNGIVVPRPTARHDDSSYTLQPSRVKRGTDALWVAADDALAARVRFILWNRYYVRAYHSGRLSSIQKDAVRRLYWQGSESPPDLERMVIGFQVRQAVRKVLHPDE